MADINSIKQDFENLLENENIAFYKTAEIINIYLQKEGKTFNIFTRIIFEENKNTQNREYLTPKLKKINDELYLGISKEIIDIDKIKSVFDNLIEHNIWKIQNNDDMNIDSLKALSKIFVPEMREVPLNNVLKKNEENSSYVIEFFSENKDILKSFDKKNYIKLCKLIKNYLPMDFLFLKDRIGNIIFQFPITLLSAKTKLNEDECKIQIEWHSLLSNKPELDVFVQIDFDENIIGFATYSGTINKEKTLKCGDTDGKPTILIKNKEKNLILWYSNDFIMDIHNQLSILSSGSRTIDIDGKSHNVKLERCEESYLGTSTLPHIIHIKNRIYDESTEMLKKQKKFLQYGNDGINKRQDALKDLRTIIKENCRRGVYIWDPYATAEDVLRTAYFCQCSNAKIKVINSFNETKKSYSEITGKTVKDFEEFKKEQINVFNLNSNNAGVNLEIRCHQGGYGWKFHDRFLIFPGSTLDKPRVWSLGTSINSIGESHSILMEIENAQNVLDSFLKLWEVLEDSVLCKSHVKK